MKKLDFKNHKRNIGIIAAFLVAIVLFNQVPADASVTDNIQNCVAAILGHMDDKLSGTFEKSSTNGKLNQMKTDVDAVNTSLDQLISPYMSSLTVWVNDSNTAYNGMQVSITDSNGKVKTAGYVARNGHYEADFGNILRGSYTISYPYIVSGKTMNFSVSAALNAGENKKQVFGDLTQMSMSEIQQVCRDGAINEIAHVGDTISDGKYTYTIIGINQDKPSDANGNLLPQGSYGDVLTFMPMGAPVGMDNGSPVSINADATPYGKNYAYISIGVNNGSWAATKVRIDTMPQYMAKLPTETQNVIGYVQKISGRGCGDSDYMHLSITGDKCFLLSGKEVFGEKAKYCDPREMDATFQYQYFAKYSPTNGSILSNMSWLRSPQYGTNDYFCGVIGNNIVYLKADLNNCTIYPAFCIY